VTSLLHRRRQTGLSRKEQLSDAQTRLVWRLCALLLDYPGQSTMELLDDLGAAATTIPGTPGGQLCGFVDHLRCGEQLVLAQHYVETFDLRRRSSLHLTYYAYGDTRKRGMALLMLKQTYRRAGVVMGEHDLPDFLPAVLEFAAVTDPKGGWAILAQHRAVLEVLRLSLLDAGSPYLAVLDALCATLPPLDTRDREQIIKLAAEGPPEEHVGLDPYAIDPAMDHHAQISAGESCGSGSCGDDARDNPVGERQPQSLGMPGRGIGGDR
jgi:nitrate reductase delta subunit